MIIVCYGFGGSINGRGGEIETHTQKRNHPNKNFISYQHIRRIHFHLNETIM